MTLNERLFDAGLLDAFGEAARRRDRNTMIELLRRVALTPEDATWSVDTVLGNPSKYGY
jgi:hypothetical protein